MGLTVTFGELMLRLTTPANQRFGQAAHLEITFGGAEANVAVMLAQLGSAASFVSKLPAHEMADRAVHELRGMGVETGQIVRGGDRLGVYYLEQGASQRAGKVIYDRARSALAEAPPGDFDWDRIFEGASWFHWSGISPALSASVAEVILNACQAARRLGLRTSFDLNYRAKLWTRGAAGEALAPLMQYVDLCVTSAEEARFVFGLEMPEGEEVAARALRDRFGFKQVALTRRRTASASTTSWTAGLLMGDAFVQGAEHEITIVDRVGAGDSFTGALIFALQRGDEGQRAVDFAVAASCLKHTVPGDYARVSLAEVEALAGGGDGGRVQR